MSTKFIRDEDEWFGIIKNVHDDGKTFGMIAEGNRIYRYHINYTDRLKYLNKNVDVTAYLFIPDYQKWVDMDFDFVKNIYGKRYFDSIDIVLENRFGTTDYIFIPSSEHMKYLKEAKEIVYSLAPLSPYISYMDAIQYIKGCFAVSVNIGLSYKEMIDYIILCPWKLEYNLICHDVSNAYGIKAEFPGFTISDILNKTDPIPVNYYNFSID